jgi:putative transposase
MQQGVFVPGRDHRLGDRTGVVLAAGNTLAAGFCVEAPSEALARFGSPGIFNTDQGTQFTSDEFTKALCDHGVELSINGRGRCYDNIFVERLWWTVKHEWVYLHPAANGGEPERSLAEFFDWYNLRRPHQAPRWRTPNEATSAD